MDALTDVLRAVRLGGTVFARAEVCSPWAVHTTGAPTGIFHAIVRGSAICIPAGDAAPIHLAAGDVVLLPHGDGHTMCDSLATPAVPIRERITKVEGEDVGQLRIAGDGPATTILCGSFALERGGAHPLLGVLPRVLLVRGDDGPLSEWVGTTLRMMARELDERSPGAETVITRMTDLLMVYALRAHIARLGPGQGGWMGGLKDPQVGRALAVIHRQPRDPWDVPSLAARAGMSRSGFSARFTELVGEPPAQYLTRWRIHLAERALRSEPATVAEIASRVGYGSEVAFSKAFKRFTGSPPGEYRRAAVA